MSVFARIKRYLSGYFESDEEYLRGASGMPPLDDSGGSSNLCNCTGVDTGTHLDYCPLYGTE